MADHVLAALLWSLGRVMSAASRIHPALRSQITRTLTFQMSAGETVSQVWEFDAPRRRIRSFRGRTETPDCAVHFRTGWQALRALVSPTTVNRVVAGLHEGSVQLTGSAFVLLWFHGLTRKFFRLGRPAGPRHELPHRYLRVDPTTWGAETVLIEPAVDHLDPTWTAAHRARSTLHQLRSTTGEPVLEP
ncbi:hypothetical protein HH308_16090 [Gordonia sp. TBRC 11910]|uniref:Uncharacterized protein n=1 Tax=Gordonia asplenii TaxID=2725283 RepID=A0A848KV30_9ACTN|nr:hypothetical protein [Gordonia asplenii]NMO02734.1 hypothetical protein [Gordonia asplenii]